MGGGCGDGTESLNIRGDPGWGDPHVCFSYLKSLFTYSHFFFFLFFRSMVSITCVVTPPLSSCPFHTDTPLDDSRGPPTVNNQRTPSVVAGNNTEGRQWMPTTEQWLATRPTLNDDGTRVDDGSPLTNQGSSLTQLRSATPKRRSPGHNVSCWWPTTRVSVPPDGRHGRLANAGVQGSLMAQRRSR